MLRMLSNIYFAFKAGSGGEAPKTMRMGTHLFNSYYNSCRTLSRFVVNNDGCQCCHCKAQRASWTAEPSLKYRTCTATRDDTLERWQVVCG